MKIVVFGDIHGRRCWSDVIARENPDKTIFLGDYVTTHENISEKIQIDNLEGILEYKELNPESVVLLRGNHDCSELGYRWAKCYPTAGKVVKDYMADNRERFLNDTQWMHREGNYIFVHAGISSVWLKEQHIDFDEINEMEPGHKFGFCPKDNDDHWGNSVTQSCTWIRPSAFAECAYKPEEFTYVVGHTTVEHIINVKSISESFPNIWLCDCLPKEYLCITDGVVEVKKVYLDV